LDSTSGVKKIAQLHATCYISKKLKTDKNKLLTAVVANKKGEIFELNGFAAMGMAGPIQVPLKFHETIKMPYGGEFMFLPDRKPILYNMRTKRIETLTENPYSTGEAIFPVAAFNSPGYVISFVSAYEEKKCAGFLPLFSYGAVGWHRGKFRSAVVLVDRERRQDLRLMKPEPVLAGIHRIKTKLPRNRLGKHLEKCALKYGCPAAKNFFIGRYEAPLPTSRYCNARCLGCISLQKTNGFSNCQERITFTPSPEEITEIALEHIKRAKNSIVSFGQGCEGDPLRAADVIESAIRKIRSDTSRGTINMNTNGSRPDILEALFRSGLDSVRISLNSVRPECYYTYFKPVGYQFSDVIKSIVVARKQKKFVSINYLNCPGFTDTPEEINALVSFLKKHPIDLIQWRNLNFDPVKYWGLMNTAAKQGTPIGMKRLLLRIQQLFPKIRSGYFNPPKEAFKSR
jgi:pyruvate-formate lyase-activating enzyme